MLSPHKASGARRPPRPGWVLGGLLLAVYLAIKLQAWGYARQAMSLERQLEELRPGLSSIVLAEQLENTRRACEEVTARVRRLDMETTRLFGRLSHMPASITLTKLEMRGGPGVRSQQSTRLQGTLLPGVRDPETVLVRWAQTLQGGDGSVVIQKLAPSFETPGLWEFDLEVGGA